MAKRISIKCKRLMTVGILVLFAYLLVACDTEEDLSFRLRTMSYNMRFEVQSNPQDLVYAWEYRKPGIVASIQSYDANIIGTQELRTWQYDELMHALGSNWAGIGETRDLPGDERSAIIYRSDIFEYLHGETLWLSETPTIRGSKSWDSAHPRVVTYGKFLHKTSDIEFYFFNTHLDHRSNEAKAKGLEMIVDLMLEVVGDYPVVLTGDFNMRPNEEGMHSINEQVDVFQTTFDAFPERFNPDGLTAHGYNGGTVGQPIDYVFYSLDTLICIDALIIRDRWEGRIFYSDHYPVYSELVLKTQNTEDV